MISEKDITIRPDTISKPGPPIFPTNSVEFVNALSHYYRAEMARMMSWRDRLDRTTNWAITGVGAMLSVSLSSPQSHHGVLLFAMVLVFLLLQIESRRYRFFDVYRSRVRLIERNYYARIFAPRELIDPAHWMNKLGDDLRLPRFSLSHNEAMARRLRRNYIWLFLIMLLAWVLKISTGTGFKEPTFFENFAQGFVRGNPHLKPERSFSWEIGAERGPLAVTYFDQRFRDLIAYSSTLLLPDSVNYANVGAALANGIEAKLGADLTNRIRISLSYTFLHTRVQQADSTDPVFVMGKPLIRRPAHTLASQLFATIGRASVTVGALCVGKRDDTGLQRVTMSPYTRVHLAAEYPLRHVTLSARVDNLVNDQHQEINGYRPLGRRVMVGGRLTAR